MVVSPPTPRTVGYKERQTRTRRSLSPTPPPPSPPREPQAKRLKRLFNQNFTRDQFGTLQLQSTAPANRFFDFDIAGFGSYMLSGSLPPPRPRVEPEPEPTPTPTADEVEAFFDGGGGAAAAAQAGVPDPFATDSD